jgi:small-conductance mechanosensitive channel
MIDFLNAAGIAVFAALQTIPGPVLAVALLAGAAILALLIFAAIVHAVRRLFRDRYPRVFSFLRRTRGVLRFGLILFALSIAVRFASLPADAVGALARLFQVGFIVLMGWLAVVAVNVAADVYLLRFRLDVADNLLARKHVTQVAVLKRAAQTLIVLFTIGAALMTFEPVRQFGVSLFASAGIAGIVVGFAARPLLSSLIAGVQIAMTQPIRIDDAIVVEGEWGWVEEITATYVVIKLWDWRRLIVPLSYFMEKPFQNWTRHTASLIGTVMIYADYTVPVQRLREKLNEIAMESPLWDRNVVNLQVTEAKENTLELRMLISARNSPQAFDLRCEVREKMIDFLQREYPNALPRGRQEFVASGDIPLMPDAAERKTQARTQAGTQTMAD